MPEIPGTDREFVCSAWDVLSGDVKTGKRVAIIGGNAVGLETALFLAHQGTISPQILHFLVANRAETWETLETLVNKGNKDVTVIEMTKRAGTDIGSSTRWTVMAELRRLDVQIMTNARAVEIKDSGVAVEKDGSQDLLPADTVIIAAGSEVVDGLAEEASDQVSVTHVIGDAKEPRNALAAIKEGFIAGLNL
jgi:2,4-dienoyl-CoA reductase (NADPH2)